MVLQGAFEGGVGVALAGQQAGTHRLDLKARIGADQIGQTVQRPVAGAAQTGEEVLRESGGLRADVLGLIEQPCGLARRVEDAVAGLQGEAAPAR